jgi:hypothetical protein
MKDKFLMPSNLSQLVWEAVSHIYVTEVEKKISMFLIRSTGRVNITRDLFQIGNDSSRIPRL